MARSTSLAFLLALGLAADGSHAALQPQSAAAPDQVRCLAVDRIVGRRPLPPDRLRFELANGAVYLNRPEGGCRSLERAGRLDLVLLELHGSQACSGDRFRVVDPAEARAVGMRAFPACRLGMFRADAGRR